MQKVSNLIDVRASCEEVFNTVVDIHKRMQLSPLWGVSRLLEVAANYPEEGSSYRIRVLTDVPFGLSDGTLNASKSAMSGFAQALIMKFGQAELEDPQSDKREAQVKTEAKERPPVEQVYFVSECEPPYKFSYFLDEDCKTIVTWRFQSIPFGTRVNYEEVFCDENAFGEDIIPIVRRVIKEWLNNIKRYSELRGNRSRLWVKWFLDRFYLKLRPDQRRVVLLMLFMQAIGVATFVIAVIGWGIASLFF